MTASVAPIAVPREGPFELKIEHVELLSFTRDDAGGEIRVTGSVQGCGNFDILSHAFPTTTVPRLSPAFLSSSQHHPTHAVCHVYQPCSTILGAHRADWSLPSDAQLKFTSTFTSIFFLLRCPVVLPKLRLFFGIEHPMSNISELDGAVSAKMPFHGAMFGREPLVVGAAFGVYRMGELRRTFNACKDRTHRE